MTAESNRVLGRGLLLSYSAGSLVETGIYGFCGLYLLNFYTDIVHLDPRLIGYAFALRFFIDAVSDPLIGYLSDRTRSRFGRRRPYLLIGALPAAVAFYLLLSPPAGSPWATFAHLTITSSALILALTVFGIPYYALAWELTPNYDERTRVAAYRRCFEIAAEILATLTIPLLLACSAGEEPVTPADEAGFYPIAAVLIGGAAAGAALITFLGTRERPLRSAPETAPFRAGILGVCRNRPFIILLATFTLVAVADQVVTSLLLYLMEHWHGIAKQNANTLFLAFFAGSLASPALWLAVAGKVGKKRAYVAAIIAWCSTFTAFAIVRWPSVPLHVVGALMGGASSGVFLLPDALFPDVIEWDELRTGKRREGIYAGIAKFSWKIGTGVCFFVVGHLLHAVGYDGETVPAPEVLDGLRLLFVGLPGLLVIAALAVFHRFPITADAHRRMLDELERRRAAVAAHGETAGGETQA